MTTTVNYSYSPSVCLSRNGLCWLIACTHAESVVWHRAVMAKSSLPVVMKCSKTAGGCADS